MKIKAGAIDYRQPLERQVGGACCLQGVSAVFPVFPAPSLCEQKDKITW